MSITSVLRHIVTAPLSLNWALKTQASEARHCLFENPADYTQALQCLQKQLDTLNASPKPIAPGAIPRVERLQHALTAHQAGNLRAAYGALSLLGPGGPSDLAKRLLAIDLANPERTAKLHEIAAFASPPLRRLLCAAAVANNASKLLETLIGAGMNPNDLQPAAGSPVLQQLTHPHGMARIGSDWDRMGVAAQTAVTHVHMHAAQAAGKASAELSHRLTALGASPQEQRALRTYLENTAPLHINFPPQAAGLFAEQENYLPRSAGWRRATEAAMFANAYVGRPRSEYPKYGSLDAVHCITGCEIFGAAMLVLAQPVRRRVTCKVYSPVNPLGFDDRRLAHMGTLDALDHVLLKLDDVSLRQIIAASRGQESARPQTASMPIEVHVHGPLAFSHDVEKVVCSRQGVALDAAGAKALQKFSKRHNVPLHWRGDVVVDAAQAPTVRQRARDLGWTLLDEGPVSAAGQQRFIFS